MASMNLSSEKRPGNRILIAEQDSGIINAYKATLKSLNYETIVVHHGFEIKELLYHSHQCPYSFDIIIANDKLPDIEGIDLIIGLKRDFPEIPCILTIGMETYRIKKCLASLALAKCIVKPFSPDTLTKAIGGLFAEVEKYPIIGSCTKRMLTYNNNSFI